MAVRGRATAEPRLAWASGCWHGVGAVHAGLRSSGCLGTCPHCRASVIPRQPGLSVQETLGPTREREEGLGTPPRGAGPWGNNSLACACGAAQARGLSPRPPPTALTRYKPHVEGYQALVAVDGVAGPVRLGQPLAQGADGVSEQELGKQERGTAGAASSREPAACRPVGVGHLRLPLPTRLWGGDPGLEPKDKGQHPRWRRAAPLGEGQSEPLQGVQLRPGACMDPLGTQEWAQG